MTAAEKLDRYEQSPARVMMLELEEKFGPENAARVCRVALSKFTTLELAALAENWGFWARVKQRAPANDTEWFWWGFLTGRGFGKTLAISKHINEEVLAGRATEICLIAQDEASSVAIQVKGRSGLIATAPPWNRPEFIASEMKLVWPNGAVAYVRTPEVPDKIRGLEYQLSWATEIQSWPKATRDAAWSNVLISTRLGYAHVIWDATPKKRHPILKELVTEAENDPTHCVLVRGTTYENEENLGPGYVDRLEKRYGGTARGKEELEGEMLDEDDGALVAQEAIDSNRCERPPVFVRRAMGIDPAATANKGSDRTGIIVAGLMRNEKLAVLQDLSGKYGAEEWAEIVLNTYEAEGCDLVVVETNKGGFYLTRNLRAAAKDRGWTVEVVDDKWRPHRRPKTVFVREIFSRGEKSDRAAPLATAYARNRVCHVDGADLASLETTLTTWVPETGQRSPDALDALVQVAVELLGLDDDLPNRETQFQGYTEVAAAIAGLPRPSPVVGAPLGTNLATALRGGGGGRGRI